MQQIRAGKAETRAFNQLATAGWHQLKAACIPECVLKLWVNVQVYLEINFYDYLERTANQQTSPHPAYRHELAGLLATPMPKSKHFFILDFALIQSEPRCTFSHLFCLRPTSILSKQLTFFFPKLIVWKSPLVSGWQKGLPFPTSPAARLRLNTQIWPYLAAAQ